MPCILEMQVNPINPITNPIELLTTVNDPQLKNQNYLIPLILSPTDGIIENLYRQLHSLHVLTLVLTSRCV